ncbi:MAG: DNA recombination protein RmuC [Pseudomonadota bacterium]
MTLGAMSWIGILLVGIVIGAVLGWLTASQRSTRRTTELETTLELERRAAQEREAAFESRFVTLSHQALAHNHEAFLRLAKETLGQFHIQAKGDLDLKEKAIESLVKPIREALDKTEQQIRKIENERQASYGALKSHLEGMAQTQQLLQSETRNLVQALRRPEVRGQWGELTLRRLVELAGMVEHCDFYEQEQVTGESGRLRPDMIVRMPAGREIVVDVKTPLDAYLSAVEASDDESRHQHLKRHAQNVRGRVRELASKAYWNQFANAPDFVVLFIPGDQFLSAALDQDHDLLEEALRQKVMLTTPTSFIALLRAVAYGWRQEQFAENIAQVRDLGEELYQRLAVFSEHLSRLGETLEKAVGEYNRTVGSFESKLLPGARKFPELGIPTGKPVSHPQPVETLPRQVPRE